MPPSEFLIRPLGASDDWEALTSLLHRAYRELLEMGLRFTATAQSIETTQRRCSDGECYVAEVEGRVVATIVLVGPTEDPYDPEWYRRDGVWHFGQFGVDPEYRGLGIGFGLLRFVETRASELGARWLALDTSDQALHLVSLYEKWGYSVVDTHDWGRGQDWENGVNYRSVIMAKEVGSSELGSD